MMDRYLICEAGFKNVRQNGLITGFQVKVRIANNRGMPLSLIGDVRVKINGQAFSRDKTRLSVGNRVYALDEMKDLVTAQWQFDEMAIVIIEKPGGLAPGTYDVEVTEEIRTYSPAAVCNKKLTLVA